MSDSHSIVPLHKLGNKFVFACILIGLAARWLVWFFFYDQFNSDLSDQERYLAEAYSLLHNGVFALAPGQPPTAFDGPVYATFLALVIKIFKSHYALPVLFIQSAVSLLTGWILAQIAWLITHKIFVARISMAWWTVYPFALFYSSLILTETMYAFFLVFTVWLSTLLIKDMNMKTAIYLGIVLGLTSLFRATINAAIPILFLALIFLRRDRFIQISKLVFVAGITAFLVISPWVIRNYHVFGKILPGSSQTGRMLYLANNPLNKTGYVVIPRDAQPPAQQPGENELQYNDRLMRLSTEFIKAHPGQFAKLCLIRAYEFWRPYPKFSQFQTAKIMIACLGTLLPLYACSLWGLVLLRKKWRNLGPLLAVLLASYALHLVFGVSIRYRFPIEPLLIPTAAYSVYWLLQKNFPGWITDESDTPGKS